MQMPLKVCQIAIARFREDPLGSDFHLPKVCRDFCQMLLRKQVLSSELECACWLIQAQ